MIEREFLILELLRFKKEHNRMPRQRDMLKSDGYPSWYRYREEFGSWNNVIDKVFLNREDGVTEKEFLIAQLLRFLKENDREPRARDMKEYNGYPSYNRYCREFGSWDYVINEVFSKQEGLIQKRTADKEFLIAELLRFRNENNRIPVGLDMQISSGYPSLWEYIMRFGSWNNALNEVFYNKEYLIKEFLRFEEENGRIPKPHEIKREDGHIARSRYQEVFGSWAEAIRQTPFKTKIDEHFFSPENMTVRKWYIVGYIIGDGCVNDNRLSISTTDKDNLYDMYQYMNLDTGIYIQQEDDSQTRYTIAKRNKQWFSDLGLYGIVPRKTFTSYIPLDYLKTPEKEAALLLGLFDSDGSISYHNLDYLSPVFSVCGSEQLCKDYSYLVKKNCDINCNVIKIGSIFGIRIKGIEKCQKIYDFLYGCENFHIKRKKERFEKLLNGKFSLEDDNY